MRRWFLSYNSQDLALMQAFEAALRRKDAEADIFFAAKSLRAGGYWLPEIAKEIPLGAGLFMSVGGARSCAIPRRRCVRASNQTRFQ